MVIVALYAVPMMIAWLILSNQPPTPVSLGVGYVFGFAVTLLVRLNTNIEAEERPLRLIHLPRQLWQMARYTIFLSVEILVSGIDVARRIIPAQMRINPGIHLISTCDESCNPLVAALSAHAITITPGSLVIDFDDNMHPGSMYVHVLDKEANSEEQLAEAQRKRIHSIQQMLGIDGQSNE